MKSKYISILLIVSIIACIAIYFVLAANSASNVHIIGGADTPTFLFAISNYIKTPIGIILAAVASVSLVILILQAAVKKK